MVRNDPVPKPRKWRKARAVRSVAPRPERLPPPAMVRRATHEASAWSAFFAEAIRLAEVAEARRRAAGGP